MGFWGISSFCLFWIKLLWHSCKCLFVDMFLFLLGKYFGSIADARGGYVLSFIRNSELFFWWLCHYKLHLEMHETIQCHYKLLPYLWIKPNSYLPFFPQLFHMNNWNNHYIWYKVGSHCGFDLYFFDGEWYWALFHILIVHSHNIFLLSFCSSL